jgi:hypothetical protein
LEKGALSPATLPTLTFRNLYADGRCVVVLAYPGGEWKVEVFSNVDAAMDFARDNNFEVILPGGWDRAINQRSQRK